MKPFFNIKIKKLCFGILVKPVAKSTLKGQGHVAVNKPVTSRIYIVSHTWPFCSVQILVDGVNSH